jgi:hypothetical protein
MGDGEEKPRLVELAARVPQIRFITPVPYGSEFFRALRTYHVVVAPTRGEEETRIVYDALASGCVLLHSSTVTLEAALSPLPCRGKFVPADVMDFTRAIQSFFQRQKDWGDAALAGLSWIAGRTIDEMHGVRASEIERLVARGNGFPSAQDSA